MISTVFLNNFLKLKKNWINFEVIEIDCFRNY